LQPKSHGSLIKIQAQQQQVQDICSLGINLFRLLLTYLKPVLPAVADDGELFLNDHLLGQY
jgi:methionyl-tRNA synthetase